MYCCVWTNFLFASYLQITDCWRLVWFVHTFAVRNFCHLWRMYFTVQFVADREMADVFEWTAACSTSEAFCVITLIIRATEDANDLSSAFEAHVLIEFRSSWLFWSRNRCIHVFYLDRKGWRWCRHGWCLMRSRRRSYRTDRFRQSDSQMISGNTFAFRFLFQNGLIDSRVCVHRSIGFHEIDPDMYEVHWPDQSKDCMNKAC